MIRRSTFLSMLLIALCLVGWQSLSAALEIYMDQSQYHIRNHEVIRVDVKIRGAATEIRGYQIEFDYDSEHLEIVDGSAFEEGGFLYENGRTQFYAIGEPGHYQVACSILGLTWGSMGSGTLFSVYLQAIKSTDANGTDLVMPNIILRGPLNNSIPVDEINGSNVIIDGLDAYADIKAFLEGPYLSNGMMSHNLTDVLPLQSPYDNEAIASLPDVSPRYIVDWVQVQLRLTETGEEEHTFNAFLLDNGYLVNTEGTNGYAIDYTPGTSYYIIVRHRNHLGIMSAQPHEFSITPETAPQIDLPVLGSIYGPPGYGAKQLSDGVLALFAGDADGDGHIYNNDLNDYWLVQTGLYFGYQTADFDFDGWVYNNDLNVYWRPNIGSQSQIP